MEMEFTEREIDEVWITARDNGYKFVEVEQMFALIFLSEDSRSAYDYVLQGLKDKKNAGIMCRKLTRELPESAVEYWDDSVFGKRSEWGKDEDENICPVCGQDGLDGSFDICDVCGWENDPYQIDHPDESGANHLSLNEYKKWWAILEAIMPNLTEKYGIVQGKNAWWKYDDLIVPRENMREFVGEMSRHNIALQANFYFICEEYKFDKDSFMGIAFTEANDPKENNDELLKIVFSEDPVKTCEKYKLAQIRELLNDLHDFNAAKEKWAELTPHIAVMPNLCVVPVL